MRAFRTTPPNVTAGAIARPRLLARLARRFEQPLTLISGAAGFGKSTLLAQAITENALAPVGIDHWLRAEPADSDATYLRRGIAAALEVAPNPPDSIEPDSVEDHVRGLVEALWAKAPTPVALIIDDAHEIQAGSDGDNLLRSLARELPANAHLVIASRRDLVVDHARAVANHEAIVLTGDDLRFDETELLAVARAAGLDPGILNESEGWPAITTLLAAVGRSVADQYLWDEVLALLPAETREELAALVVLGGADTDVLAAALQREVDVEGLARAVPLVSIDESGWCEPHALWTPVAADILDHGELDGLRQRAADRLAATDRLGRAIAVLLDADLDNELLWARLGALLNAACRIWLSLVGELPLHDWLARLPSSRRSEPETLLLAATVARRAGAHLDEADARLREAWEAAKRAQRYDVETSVLSQFAHVAWWRDDLATMAELYARALERAELGQPLPAEHMALAEVILADIRGDDTAMLAALRGVDPEERDLAAAIEWFRARALVGLGRAAEAIPHADRAARRADAAFHSARLSTVTTRWYSGEPTSAMELAPQAVPRTDALARDRFIASVVFAIGYAHLGRLDEAHRQAAEAEQHVRAIEPGRSAVYLHAMRSIVALACGDDAAASSEMDEAVRVIDNIDLAQGLRAVQPFVGSAYLLAPRIRDRLDGIALGPDRARALTVAGALLAARSTAGTHTEPLPPLGAQVAALPLLAIAELAVRRADATHAAALVSEFGTSAAEALRSLAQHHDRVLADAARDLLRRVPLPPVDRVRVLVLGPSTIERADGVVPPDWRRERVRSLFAMLVVHGTVTREQAMTALWPELDTPSGSSNLRRTLNYLHGALEPDRPTGAAAWFVRSIGDTLRLEREGLDIDRDELERELDSAQRADTAGLPSVAMAHYERAIAAWRGEFCAELFDDWVLAERDRVRTRFVAASVRFGELLLGAALPDRALAIAIRTLSTDRWSEPAHRLAVAAHLARGDRAGARRCLDAAMAALRELGVHPDPATVMLARALD